VPAGAAAEARLVAQDRGIAVFELVPGVSAAGMFELRGGPAGRTVAPAGARSPDAVALVLHTSGTTARPKIVPLTHAKLCLSAENIAATLELSPADRCLNVMPLFHVHGLIGALLASLTAGASVVCAPGFQAPRFLDWLEDMAPTWYTAVPTMHQAIVDRAVARGAVPVRSSLRFIRSSSAALPPPLMARLERTFAVPVTEAYGMTEASHQVASNPLPPRVRKPGSVGLPAGPEVAVLGTGNRVLGANSTGEIAIRGDSVLSGYENNPQANAAAFTDGWFRTGDQGYRDDDGYIFLTGRLKELINSGGEKVAPSEVDAVLLAHDAVAQVVTFGLPDARLGEAVAAAVVMRPGAEVTERQLRQFVATRLAFFKVPARVVFVDELPKGPTGKLQRIGLADRLGLRQEPVRRDLSVVVDERARRVAGIAAEVLELPGLDAQANFFDAGGDSVTGAVLVARLREAFGVEVAMFDLLDAPSLAALSGIIATRGASPSMSAAAAVIPAASESYHVDGRLRPLVYFHAATEGDAFYGRALAESLGPDQPVHVFAPLGLDGSQVPDTVEGIARACLQRVRERQPSGPYQLLGYCISGTPVFEMARQLRDSGETVAFVGIIESTFRPLGRSPRAVAAVLDALGGIVSQPRRARVLRALRRPAGPRAPGEARPYPEALRVRSSYQRAIAAYAAWPVDVPRLVHFRAQESAPSACWQGLSPGYAEVVIPGGHESCVLVHTPALASALAPWLADSADGIGPESSPPRSTA
jgi:thioesterase domain-containing protein/aryl carrier-like protein